VLLRGTPHHFDLLAASGAEALAIDDRGLVHTTPGMWAYLADPAPTVVHPDRFRALQEAAS